MNDLQFKHLLKPDLYQVFLLGSPASIPISMWSHPWFLLNKKGDVQRWEIIWLADQCATSWGHLHKNRWPALQGLEVISSSFKLFWPSRLSGFVEGGESSLAHRMSDFIERSPETYPHCYEYSFLGPNSNTYGQWVLDAFPEAGLHLRWNSYGKSFKVGTIQ